MMRVYCRVSKCDWLTWGYQARGTQEDIATRVLITNLACSILYDKPIFACISLLSFVAGAVTDAPADEAAAIPVDPLIVLRTGRGMCNHRTVVVCFAAQYILGMPARSIEVHPAGIDGHTFAEVYYDARWHMLDVLTGPGTAMYLDDHTNEPLSFTELQTRGVPKRTPFLHEKWEELRKAAPIRVYTSADGHWRWPLDPQDHPAAM
jgi:hypothetical protein